MCLVLIEGQPGSGKTSLIKKLGEYYQRENISYRVISESEQDNIYFGDYWEEVNDNYNIKIEQFLTGWKKIINELGTEEIVFLDHSIFNQVQYLMSLDISFNKIEDFFIKAIKIITDVESRVVFLDGDSDTVIKRVNKARTNGWGARVIEVIASTDYQINRNREGLNGMVAFFADSQVLKRKLLKHWEKDIFCLDITEGEWENNYLLVKEFLLN